MLKEFAYNYLILVCISIFVNTLKAQPKFYSFTEGGKWGIQDKQGFQRLLPIYDSLTVLVPNTVFAVEKNKRWGLVGFDEDVMYADSLPFQYDSFLIDIIPDWEAPRNRFIVGRKNAEFYAFTSTKQDRTIEYLIRKIAIAGENRDAKIKYQEALGAYMNRNALAEIKGYFGTTLDVLNIEGFSLRLLFGGFGNQNDFEVVALNTNKSNIELRFINPPVPIDLAPPLFSSKLKFMKPYIPAAVMLIPVGAGVFLLTQKQEEENDRNFANFARVSFSVFAGVAILFEYLNNKKSNKNRGVGFKTKLNQNGNMIGIALHF